MASTKTDLIMGIACIVLILVCIIASMISLNCWADKKNQCAQVAGFTAVLTGCLMCAIACCFYVLMTKAPKLGAAPPTGAV